MADHEPAAKDPEVRLLLTNCTNVDVLLSLIRSPQGDTVSLLRRLKQLSPLKAARLLADGPEEIRAVAPREMMIELLQNSSREVGVTAFRALGGFPSSPQVECTGAG